MTDAISNTEHTPFTLHFGVEGAGPFGKDRDSPFELDFPAGVNVLVAPNNWGKSWMMRLLARFNFEKLTVGDLSVNDQLTGGMARAWVNGATMRARAGRAPEIDGTPPQIDALPEPIAVLAHGRHMKGHRPAFKARLGALLQWVAMNSTEATLRRLLGADQKIVLLYGRIIGPNGALKTGKPGKKDLILTEGVDLIEATIRIREAIHAMRRREQEKLKISTASVDGINGRKHEILGDVDIDEATLSAVRPDVDGVHDSLGKARAHHATVSSQRLSGVAERGRRAQALQDLGERPDPGPKLAAAKRARRGVDRVDDETRTARAEVERLRAELARAEERLSAAQQRAVERVEAVEHAEAEHRETHEAAKRWDRLHAELSSPLQVPEKAEVEKAKRAVDDLERCLGHHRAAVRYRQVSAELEAEHERAGDLTDRVEFLRTEADDVWSRLATAVNEELRGDRVRVGSDEVIEVNIDGGWFDITDEDRVGEGVTFSACYELLLRHRRGQRVVVVEGHTTIDPPHLDALGRRARAQDTVLILERAPVQGEQLPADDFKLETYPEGTS